MHPLVFFATLFVYADHTAHPLHGNYEGHLNSHHISVSETGHVMTTLPVLISGGEGPSEVPLEVLTRLKPEDGTPYWSAYARFLDTYYYPYFPNTITCAFPARLRVSWDGEFLDAEVTVPARHGIGYGGRCFHSGMATARYEFKKVES